MSTRSIFPAFPDDARLWVYTADRPLTAADQQALQDALDAFFAQWLSHGRAVQGAATCYADRFVLLAAEIPGGDISGCGIDASVHVLDALANDLGFRWASGLVVAYRAVAGPVQVVPRRAFKQMARAGEVGPETTVFDLGVTTVGDLRHGKFEGPAQAMWHSVAFGLTQPAAPPA